MSGQIVSQRKSDIPRQFFRLYWFGKSTRWKNYIISAGIFATRKAAQIAALRLQSKFDGPIRTEAFFI